MCFTYAFAYVVDTDDASVVVVVADVAFIVVVAAHIVALYAAALVVFVTFGDVDVDAIVLAAASSYSGVFSVVLNQMLPMIRVSLELFLLLLS